MDKVSIAEAKRDLSRVVNRAAFGQTPIVLTSRGRPKAVLIGHEEYLRLSGRRPQTILNLGGSWKGKLKVRGRDLLAVRKHIWGKLMAP